MWTKQKLGQALFSAVVISAIAICTFKPTLALAQTEDSIERAPNAQNGRISLIGQKNGRVLPAFQGSNFNHIDTSLTVTSDISNIRSVGKFSPNLLGATWYVATTGNDSNSCTSTDSPCATINGALGKATAGDTIKVAIGTYTGSGTEVVLIYKDITLSGGWNAAFTTQNGDSTIDGQNNRRCIVLGDDISATIEYFIVQNGNISGGGGGGIFNYSGGTMVMNHIIVTNNTTTGSGGGIYSGGNSSFTLNNSSINNNNGTIGGIFVGGIFTLNNSTVSGNDRHGIYNNISANLILNNSTVSGNTANQSYDVGAGILNASGTVTISNSTITNNIVASDYMNGIYNYGGGIYNDDGTVIMQNTILAGNIASGSGPDCFGIIESHGYNLLGNNSGCTFTATADDKVGTDVSPINPYLTPLQNYGGPTFTHAFMTFKSPAIDAGDNATCASTDQRGVARPIDGDNNGVAICDIGAVESNAPISIRTIAKQDGWILESSETSNKGKARNNTATTLYLGDDVQNKQYRSILPFSTKGLPDNAVITKVILKVKKQRVIGGGNPVNLFQGFMVDVKKGFFGSVPGLQGSDFQVRANKSYGPFKPALKNGWYIFNLTSAKAYINELNTNGGVTQVRLRFKLDDNNNNIANYLRLYSGNARAASRPQLIIEYYIP